jgi:hypothetical protein
MENPRTGTSSRPEEVYAAAAERFFELMKTFGMAAAGRSTDWSALATPLASQFERWLQMSQGAGGWFGGAAAGSPAGLGFGAPAAAAFGPLPLGPAAVQGGEGSRTLELLGRLAQLQGELAKHWSEIAGTAAQRFVARLGPAAAAPATPQQALRLYELWVECAEEAYATTVHKEEFARLQAELANTTAALLAEQRRQAESLVRAFGLPTRNEVDTLYAQVKDLRRQLAELAEMPRASGASAPAARATGSARGAEPRDAGAASPPRRAAPKGAKRSAARVSAARTRARRSRR